jgi:hypothetical protein
MMSERDRAAAGARAPCVLSSLCITRDTLFMLPLWPNTARCSEDTLFRTQS